MPDFDLSVTICSWNTKDDLRACLKSLSDARNEASFEVIVVDNNSEDGSPSMVAVEFPWVVLLAQNKNLGFTGGNNLALESRKGKHAFLLNSDASVHPGALAKMLEFANTKPDAGIFGPKVLNPDGTLQMSCRKFPNPIAALFRSTLFGKIFPKNRFVRDYLMSDFAHDQVQDVDWVSGCAMFVTEQVLEKVGLMDPNYFMFCEDVDWCFRARKAGFAVYYVPSAVVTHAIGRSTDKAPNRMIGRFHISMFYFYSKNILAEKPILVRPFLWVLAAVGLSLRAFAFIIKNKIDILSRRFAK
jgi:GT2 family glycosyltransferase